MSLIGQENMALHYEDMGEPSVYGREALIDDREADAEMRLWELSKYSTEELQAELDTRETKHFEEIPIMKGTLEMLDNISIGRN